MKKVFMTLAAVALLAAATSCSCCNNCKKAVDGETATECCATESDCCAAKADNDSTACCGGECCNAECK